MSTRYKNLTPSDTLELHDVLRVTFVAPSHWFETKSVDSEWFRAGLDNLFFDDSGGLAPLSADPYTPGDLSATIDFLWPSFNRSSVADALSGLLVSSRGGGINFQDLVAIDQVEKIVGSGVAAPGTTAAEKIAFGPDSAEARQQDQEAAQAAAEASTSWLSDLTGTLGTAGKVVAVVVVAAVGYGLYKRSRG